jgi:predicted ATPase
MIAAIQFRKFKALRSAAVQLGPFNLLVGPSGSGKTSLITALLRLRSLAGGPAAPALALKEQKPAGPEIDFHFDPPFGNIRVTLGCSSDDLVCNLLAVEHPPGREGEGQWAELRTRVQGIRAYLFDHTAMAVPANAADGRELSANAGNLAAVLAARKRHAPESFARLEEEVRRLMPEFAALDFHEAGAGRVELRARLAGENEVLAAADLSQGTLNLLALLTLALAPEPPALVCLEEADRGMHPRMLREVRDALYRLSHPQDAGKTRPPVQVIATTHSPYLLDLFKDHPEEVVLAQKRGRLATFTRLSENADVKELMKEAHLGDLWYSGVLGGVPEE